MEEYEPSKGVPDLEVTAGVQPAGPGAHPATLPPGAGAAPQMAGTNPATAAETSGRLSLDGGGRGAGNSGGTGGPQPSGGAAALPPPGSALTQQRAPGSRRNPPRQSSMPVILSGSGAEEAAGLSREQRTQRLALRRGMAGSFTALQASLPQDVPTIPMVNTRVSTSGSGRGRPAGWPRGVRVACQPAGRAAAARASGVC